MSRRLRSFSRAGLLSVLTVAACGDDAPRPTDAPLQPKGTFQVRTFDGSEACAQLEAHIEDTAAAMLREKLESYARPVPVPAPVPVSAPAPAASDSSSGASTGSGTPAFSETNVRVPGVDEPDPVKTDGRRLYSLREDAGGLTLSTLALTPVPGMRVLGQARWARETTLPGMAWPAAPESAQGLMLVAPDALVALSSGARTYPMPVVGPATDAASPAVLCVDSGCGPGGADWGPPRTRVRRFDVGADADPVEQWLLDLPGSLLAARRIGSRLYLVTQAALRLPAGVLHYPDIPVGGPSWGTPAWDAAVEATIAENERLIREASLGDWLADLRVIERVGGPSATARTLGGATITAQECARFARIDVATRLAWLRVSTIDLDTRSVASETLLANGQGVFMSERSLIVSTPYWRRGDEFGNPRNLTVMHRFGLGAAGEPAYEGSGEFAGRLINDYAIDESADGTIRIAATDWDGGAYSYVATFGAVGGRLERIGASERIAPGETLQSARFVGERAYLVTFRQIDPFFVYDLSDPSAPRRLGELKLPGFSTYLHPVDADHLLGIGYDAGTSPRRLKATLFDVADPASPREAMSIALGDVYTGSDAIWDPHAFTFFRPPSATDEALVAVPVRSYGHDFFGTVSFSGIRVLRVAPADATTPLSIRGTLSMTDLLDESQRYDGWRRTDARRAVFIDDSIYGVSDGAVRAAGIGDPGVPLETVSIP